MSQIKAIAKSSEELVRTIESGKYVHIDTKSAKWNECFFSNFRIAQLFYRLLGWDSFYKIKTYEAFVQSLHATPQIIYKNDCPVGVSQPESFPDIKKAVVQVKQSLDQIKNPDLSKKITRLKFDLERQVLMLQYLGENTPVFKRTSDTEKKVETLFVLLKNWQKRLQEDKKNVDDYTRPEVLRFTKEKLERVATYRKFYDLLIEDAQLQEEFFRSVLRYNPERSKEIVDLFIQMPTLAKEVTDSFIGIRAQKREDQRVRALSKKSLKFSQTKQNGKILKNVSLLFQPVIGEKSVYQSVVDSHLMIEVAKGVERSVEEIFHTFRRSKDYYVDMEMLHGGISYCDIRMKNQKLNLDKEDWYEDLPDIDVRTREDIEKLYGEGCFQEGHAFLAMEVTRMTKDLNPKDAHAYYNAYIPKKDGTFNRVSLGFFASTFPVTTKEFFFHVFRTHPANVVTVDPNKFYNQREHRTVNFPPLDIQRFKKLMNIIREDVQNSRSGALYFQGQGTNCTAMAVNVVKRLYDDLVKPEEFDAWFKTDYKDFIVPQPLMAIAKCPSFLRRFFLILLGAWQGYSFVDKEGVKQTKRVMTNEAFQKGYLMLPCKFFFQEERVKSVLGRINEGGALPVPVTVEV